MVQEKQKQTMNSRTRILSSLNVDEKQTVVPPDLPEVPHAAQNALERFTEVLTSIGGAVITVKDNAELTQFIRQHFPSGLRIISIVPGLDYPGAEPGEVARSFEDAGLTILNARFGVAENGAVWLTNQDMGHPVLPFISQHLLVVLRADALVNNLHEAYDRIGDDAYSLGIFIAGPSKTADIEQSLVLGAHGPASMTVAIMRSKETS
jgi:L-lactate dehydrogenase complex protein LldG